MTQTRTLGDAAVFPIGLGGMPLSLKGRPDEDQAIRTIHAALDAGVTLIDTADAYAYDESGAVAPVNRAAERHEVSPQQVALAWLLALSPVAIPIPGSTRPETITESVAAAELALSDAEVREISAAVGIA